MSDKTNRIELMINNLIQEAKTAMANADHELAAELLQAATQLCWRMDTRNKQEMEKWVTDDYSEVTGAL